MKNEIVLFETKDKEISMPVSLDEETVWLSANQMASLFLRISKSEVKEVED